MFVGESVCNVYADTCKNSRQKLLRLYINLAAERLLTFKLKNLHRNCYKLQYKDLKFLRRIGQKNKQQTWCGKITFARNETVYYTLVTFLVGGGGNSLSALN